MGKLHKARPDSVLAPKPARKSRTPPPPAIGSSASASTTTASPRRPPSLLSSAARSSPPTARVAAPLTSQASVDAHGELIEIASSEGSLGGFHRSRSPTRSSGSPSIGRTASPPDSPARSHRRVPSTGSTTYSVASSSPDARGRDSASLAHDNASIASSSALAQLRTRLDVDEAARSHAAERERPHKLKKKAHPSVAVEREAGALLPAVETRNSEQARLGEHAGPDSEQGRGAQGVEELGSGTAGGIGLGGAASTDLDWIPPVAVNLPPPVTTAVPSHPALSSPSRIFAPARFGWRLASAAVSSSVSFGIDTSRAVLSHVPLFSHVPVIGALVAGGDVPEAPQTDRTAAKPAQPTVAHPSALIVAPPAPSESLVYRAIELSLGVGLASGLVTLALAGMAWDKVKGRPLRE
ncbi:hypothetical protein Rhopal_004911-T1 [Rhodotorula paludigena]|uniref:Proteophosphoglycan ppg4 n=1 Tax=Rhodotorula paludigena TaxID=86838 RepID=A0AAV5GQV1_9BASI|nr:hypothetical protein Rhopal_004911-T1 [Rhodotorula paludigena]